MDFNVKDYSYLTDAASEASKYNETFASYVEQINTLIGTLSNSLMGPIADSCTITWNQLKESILTVVNSLSDISTTLNTTVENYIVTDKKVAEDISDAVPVNTTAITPVTTTTLTKNSGNTVKLPSGLGNIHTYMGWQCVTNKNSNQYKLREAAGMNFDTEGFAKIDDRYVVATTTTFGKVGDYVDFTQTDGSVLHCVIGDIKNQQDANANQWGHNNGKCVVEFVVDKNTWYDGNRGGHVNPGNSTFHPEWNQNIVSSTNYGNYFDIHNSSVKV